jgi:acetyltransferase
VTVASLRPFFEPASVAVIGASRDPSKVGGSVLANLRAAGFDGRIIPVNANAGTVQGLPAVASLEAVPGRVDLAVITLPAAAVLEALQACERLGVGGAVLISAGFREMGGEGLVRETALRAWLSGRRLRLLGPNCLGWIRPSRRLNLTFAPGMPQPGPIAFVSHSGALAVAILDWARERRIGFSLFASLGNQADINESDILDAVAEDDETRVVVAYVEGVADGRRFLSTLTRVAALKPVVVLKTGRSAEGARAVSSHTGALAGSDAAFDAAVKQAGAVRARSVEELFDLARALAVQPLPRGRRLLILTNGGGLGIVAADAAHEAGLTLPPPGDDARSRLRAVLPRAASVENPIDIVGDADAARYANALGAAGPEGADAALVVLTAQAATESVSVARAILGATRDWPIPLATAFVGGGRVAPGARALEEAGVPCYAFPEHAVAALGGMALLAERRRRPPTIAWSAPPAAARLLLSALGAHPATAILGMTDLAALLTAYGIRVAESALAATPEEAGRIAGRLGAPVAVKIVSPDIIHKTDVGAVRLNLRSPEAVVAAAADMWDGVRRARPEAMIAGVLVQRMVPPGVEMLLGATRDPQFGPLVVVGLGGIYVEVLRDTASRLAPFGPAEARTMIEELRMAPALCGYRGQAPADVDELARVASQFSRLAADAPHLVEMEVNPLMVSGAGAMAVDARARVEGVPVPATMGSRHHDERRESSATRIL